MDSRIPTLKKIRVKELQVGMFIADLQKQWLDHPFLRNRKMITSRGQIEKIKEYGILEVTIDTARGLDVAAGEEAGPPPAPSWAGTARGRLPARAAGAVEQNHPLFPVGKDPSHSSWEEIVERNSREIPLGRVRCLPRHELPLDREVQTARAIHREAQVVVRSIMEDVRLGKTLQSEPIRQVVNAMIASIFSNRYALVSLSRIKGYDDYTFVHSINAAILCLALGHHLRLSRNRLLQIGLGALLHDIGKMRISSEILNKTGPLNDAEWAEMKRHPLYGLEILEAAGGIPEESKQTALQHHERFSGRGYPYGLKGEQISRFGQMAAIADVYDAVTSDRVYKKAVRLHEGIRTIYDQAREDFNPVLVGHFIQCIGIYPEGTIVRLDTGEIGIVWKGNPETLLRPHVLLIGKDHATPYSEPLFVDLREREGRSSRFIRTISSPLDPRQAQINIENYLPGIDPSAPG